MLSTIALGRPYWGISWEVLFTRDKKKFLNISRRKEKPWRARIRKELTLSQSFIQEDNGAMSPELHGKWNQPKILYSARLWNVRIKTFANVHILFFFFFFGRTSGYLPDQGSNPHPLQWKCRILTTGPPGKLQIFVLIRTVLSMYLLSE